MTKSHIDLVKLLASDIDKIGHIPKADELHTVKDMLYIIHANGDVIEDNRLLVETRKILVMNSFSSWAEPTFREYLLLMTYLKLIKVKNHHASLNSDILSFLEKNPWRVQTRFSDFERKIFRDRLLQYKALLRFLEVVFCGKRHYHEARKIITNSVSVKGRKTVLSRWMEHFHLTDDRDARAMLTWCRQTGIVERDGYSDTYYLVQEGYPSYDDFVKSLIKSYRKAYDRDIRRAKVPLLRIKTCEDLHISLPFFDEMLERVERKNPKAVFMDRATSIRDEVANYGIKRKGFYYYYVKLTLSDLK